MSEEILYVLQKGLVEMLPVVWLKEYFGEVLLYLENQEWNVVPIQVASSSLNYSICWIAIFMSWI